MLKHALNTTKKCNIIIFTDLMNAKIVGHFARTDS